MQACFYDSKSLVEFLLSRGADINRTDEGVSVDSE